MPNKKIVIPIEKHLITLFGEEIGFNYEIKDLINLADLKSNGLIKEELTTIA